MDNNYGKWIKLKLIEKGMTQKELAEIIGYTRAGLCRIVTGQHTPHRKAAMKIQEVLGKYGGDMTDIEQQARLLTIEEVMEHYSIPISKADIERYNDYAEDIKPLYFDFPTCDGWEIHWRGYDNVSAYLREWEKDYGITWRCWTDKPTEEQRKAIPWETH